MNAAEDKSLDANRPSLGEVVELLGPVAMRLMHAPKGIDVPVGEPVIYDAALPSPLEAGDLVLAAGLTPGLDAFRRMLEAAGREHVAGVAVHANESSTTFDYEAESVALLEVAPGMPWGHLYSLLRSAIDSGRVASRAGEEGDDVDRVGLGDLYGVMNAIAARAGGAALLDDADFNVLAYSNLDHPIDDLRKQAVLRRRGPGKTWRRRFQSDGLHHRLREADDVVRVDGYPRTRARLVMPVRAGNELLGFLWLSEGTESFDEATAATLRDVAPLVALHLVRYRADLDVGQQLLAQAIRACLEGTGSPSLLAPKLGTVPEADYRVAAFSLRSHDQRASAIRQTWVRDLVALYFEAYQGSAACVATGDVVYVLVSQSAASNLPRIQRVCIDIAGYLQRERDLEVVCGIGSVVSHLKDAPRSRAEAEKVLLALASRRTESSVASIEQVHAQVFLDDLGMRSDLHGLMRWSKLGPLVEHDRVHGTFYVRSLEAFLDAHGDYARAAASVNVHTNTLRYRIGRLREIAQVDLDDPDERLVLGLQLRILGSPASNRVAGGDLLGES